MNLSRGAIILAAASVVFTTFIGERRGSGYASVWEVYLTPDFQYVIHPNGLRDVASAAVFAGEVGLTF